MKLKYTSLIVYVAFLLLSNTYAQNLDLPDTIWIQKNIAWQRIPYFSRRNNTNDSVDYCWVKMLKLYSNGFYVEIDVSLSRDTDDDSVSILYNEGYETYCGTWQAYGKLLIVRKKLAETMYILEEEGAPKCDKNKILQDTLFVRTSNPTEIFDGKLSYMVCNLKIYKDGLSDFYYPEELQKRNKF